MNAPIGRTRLSLLAAITSVAAVGSLAGAGPASKQLLTDPAGDARVLGAGYDVVSANLATTGTVNRRGTKRVHTPTALVATVTMAGKPSTSPGTTITFTADTSACPGTAFTTRFTWSYTPGAVFGGGWLDGSNCGEPVGDLRNSKTFTGAPTVRGNTITWIVSLKDFGSDLPLKSSFSKLRVRADQNDPVYYHYGTGFITDWGTMVADEANASVDTATSNAIYILK